MARRKKAVAIYRDLCDECSRCGAKPYTCCLNKNGRKKAICRLDEENGHAAPPPPVQRDLFARPEGGDQ